ncbi:MAG: hypothetical protein ACRCXZ_09895 [Patescibacteria group bacterium]
MKVVLVEYPEKINPTLRDHIKDSYLPDVVISLGFVQSFELPKEPACHASLSLQTAQLIEHARNIGAALDVDEVINPDDQEILRTFLALKFILKSIQSMNITLVIYGGLADQNLYELLISDPWVDAHEEIEVYYNLVEPTLQVLQLPCFTVSV